MTLGARIKEERRRLGKSQTEFASLAGASRRAMANWEADGSAPVATALVAWSNAGADALYILTGSRASPKSSTDVLVRNRLDEIHRDILDASRWQLPGENQAEVEARILGLRAEELSEMLGGLTQSQADLRSRAEALLAICEKPEMLSSFRAADFVKNRKRREEAKEQLVKWLQHGKWQLGDEALSLLTTLHIEYGVPLKLLVEVAVLCNPTASAANDA